MAKFNLNSLSKCGAKTRSGKPCKRVGNKINGRCKLHGGRSTGAKTKEGKFAVRLNPLLSFFAWFIQNHIELNIKKEDSDNAICAYLALLELCEAQNKAAYDHAMEIIAEYRVELEMLKYCIAEYEGAEALLLIQSALDHYYKDNSNEHLLFHLHSPIYPTPCFNEYLASKAQYQKISKMDNKELAKKGWNYAGRMSRPPNNRIKRITATLTKWNALANW